MIKIEERELEIQNAREIANKLLEVFNYFVYKIGIIYISYPSYYDKSINKQAEKQDFYTTFYTSDRMSGFTCKRRKKQEQEKDLYDKHNTYYVHYETRNYEIKFYDNPEICGYNTPVIYNNKTDIFCSIRSLNAKNETVYEMDFTFNIETMQFLELYDLERKHRTIEEDIAVLNKNTGEVEKSEKMIVKRCDIAKLEKELYNRVLADIFKLDDTLLT